MVDKIKAADITTTVGRLAKLLAQEAELLKQMKIRQVGELTEEKVKLMNLLDFFKKELLRKPELKDSFAENEKEELKRTWKIYQEILRENFRRLMVATEVNAKVVEAIKDAVAAATASGVYGDKGGQTEMKTLTPLTLNQMI